MSEKAWDSTAACSPMYVDGAAVLQAADLTYAGGYFGLLVGPGGAAEFRGLTAYLPGSVLVEE